MTDELSAGAGGQESHGADEYNILIASSLGDLLGSHDTLFVRRAYATFLRRLPDQPGLENYAAMLRNGAQRIFVLAVIAGSQEARGIGVVLPGMARALARYKRAQTPVIGWFIRMITGQEGNRSSERRFRAMSNDIHRLRYEMEALLTSIPTIVADQLRVPELEETPSQVAQRALDAALSLGK